MYSTCYYTNYTVKLFHFWLLIILLCPVVQWWYRNHGFAYNYFKKPAFLFPLDYIVCLHLHGFLRLNNSEITIASLSHMQCPYLVTISLISKTQSQVLFTTSFETVQNNQVNLLKLCPVPWYSIRTQAWSILALYCSGLADVYKYGNIQM